MAYFFRLSLPSSRHALVTHLKIGKPPQTGPIPNSCRNVFMDCCYSFFLLQIQTDAMQTTDRHAIAAVYFIALSARAASLSLCLYSSSLLCLSSSLLRLSSSSLHRLSSSSLLRLSSSSLLRLSSSSLLRLPSSSLLRHTNVQLTVQGHIRTNISS